MDKDTLKRLLYYEPQIQSILQERVQNIINWH